MKRRQLLTGVFAGLGVQVLAAVPATAATFVEQVVIQLREQGFSSIKVERTLLGRARIAARRVDGSREIVLNPNTGEILRDLWTSTSGASSGRIKIGSYGGGDGGGPEDHSGHGSNGDDGDGEDHSGEGDGNGSDGDEAGDD